MRCLILGGDGMLGHQLLTSWRRRHEVGVSLRGPLSAYSQYGLFHKDNSFPNIDICNIERVLEVIGQFSPDAIVNCVGIIKQRSASNEVIPSLEVNSLFPHRLQRLCNDRGIRMVHLSTDCVFSGQRGHYTENDLADAEDLYGRTKFLGEVSEAPCVTLRSSIIGLELSRKKSLIEWFLAQRGTIKGFVRAMYTGVTTLEMARIIEHVLMERVELHGVWQVAAEPIDKFHLLLTLAEKLSRQDIVIEPDDQFVCDRSLIGDAFVAQTDYRVPSWDTMLDELACQIRERGRYRDAA